MNQDDNDTSDPSVKDQSRRRFTKSIAGSGVILSLASQPVLGTYAKNCSISGNISGNLSQSTTGGTACNVCGKGKDYWEPKTECKDKDFSYYMGSDCSDSKDSSYRNKCSWILKPSYVNFCLKKESTYTDYGKGHYDGYGGCTQSGTYPKYSDSTYAYNKGATDGKNYAYTTGYKNVNKKGYRDGFFESYDTKWKTWGHSYSQREYQRGYRDGYENECKRQYGNETDHCKGELWDFARECMITVLNCRIECTTEYPVTEKEVKDMWNACKSGGKYQVKTGVYWSRSDCINYLKKLHT